MAAAPGGSGSFGGDTSSIADGTGRPRFDPDEWARLALASDLPNETKALVPYIAAVARRNGGTWTIEQVIAEMERGR